MEESCIQVRLLLKLPTMHVNPLSLQTKETMAQAVTPESSQILLRLLFVIVSGINDNKCLSSLDRFLGPLRGSLIDIAPTLSNIAISTSSRAKVLSACSHTDIDQSMVIKPSAQMGAAHSSYQLSAARPSQAALMYRRRAPDVRG